MITIKFLTELKVQKVISWLGGSYLPLGSFENTTLRLINELINLINSLIILNVVVSKDPNGK